MKVALVSVVLLVASCGSDSDPGTQVLGVDVIVGVGDVTSVSDVQTVDLPPPSDLGGTVTPPGEPIPYQPCSENADCPSGYCVESADGRTCTRECLSDCPSGWACTSVSGSGADVVFLCVPRFVTLCMPCDTDADCSDGVLGDAKCLDQGQAGHFCGAGCSPDSADCPTGYTCDGGQCRKDDGICECTWKAVKEAATTSCSAVNEVGSCLGSRGCLNGALSQCTAATPLEESCNGVDDDCDGATDESIAQEPCNVSSDAGTCTGVTICTAGVPGCTAQIPVAEFCDGKDNDCDTLADEGFPDTDGDGVADCVSDDDDGDTIPDLTDNCPAIPNTDQADTDGNGVGDVCDADVDGDGDPNVSDCAPTDSSVGHGATEVCDGEDQDCDGLVDEGFPDLDKDTVADCVDDDDDGDTIPDLTDNCAVTPNTSQSDADGDGKGDACEDDIDGDGDPDLTDCAPNDPAVKHGAAELCNGADENCNGIVDEGFPDTDADGVMNCLDTDDDGDGVPDVDDVCPLKADPEQLDTDGDLLGDACDSDDDGDTTPDVLDCAPTDATVSPKAPEVCNGKDDDCDSVVDEVGATGCVDYLYDNDGDGFGVAASQCLCGPKAPYTATSAGDCNDQNGLVFPGATETCNAVDDDCDAATDEGAAVGCVDSYTDADKDGVGGGTVACRCPGSQGVSTLGGDCNDSDPAVKPGALETCNGKDDNCNTLTDEQGAFGCQSYFKDVDGDLAGANGEVRCLCAPEGLFTASTAGDCNDGDSDIGPAHPEVCDTKDNNCNGQVDEGVQKTWFLDEDEDGFGAAYSTASACTQPVGFVAKAGDCNDFNKDIHPTAPELCNNVDDDCDGLPDDGLPTQVIYKDNDGDGYAAVNASKQNKCDVPVGWVLPRDANGDGTSDWDCSDSDITMYPGGPTVCGDGKDNNCDGVIDRLCFTPCGGSWPYAPDYSTDTPQATIADLHGDGNAEAIINHAFGFAILRSDGLPLLNQSAAVYNTARTPPVLADFDDTNSFGAGVQSLEIAAGNGSAARLFKVASNGAVTETNSNIYVYDASRFMAQDIDGDGKPEFVTSTWCQAAAAKVFRYDAGALTLVREIPAPTEACNYYNGRTLSDLDGDGTPELLWGEGYAVPTTPSYWSGALVARSFSPAPTLTPTPYCAGPDCFPHSLDGLYGGAGGDLIRFATEIRSLTTAFGDNVEGVTNPSVTWTLRYGLDGKRTAAAAGNSLWQDTTDVNDDGVLESYGADVAGVGLFDLNGDGYPDRLTTSGQNLRVQLWDEASKSFKTNVGSDMPVSASGIALRAAWDLDGDGRIQVLSADTSGAVYCHEMGQGTWNPYSSLPPKVPAAYRTYQWDNYEPNDGGDANMDGLPDHTLRLPSALTATGTFASYLSTPTDRDYFVVDADWSARICLRAPKGRTYGLEIYAFLDRWNNSTKSGAPDSKPDGLIWQDLGNAQQKCFTATSVTPYRQGEFKFVVGVVPVNGSFSPHWPYYLHTPK